MKRMFVAICVITSSVLANISYWEPDADAEVLESEPTSERGASECLSVQYNYIEEEERSFIHFDLSDVSPGTYIESGILYFRLWWTMFNSGILTVCKVEDDWEEYAITWNNQPEYDPDKILYQDWIPQWQEYMSIELDGSIIQEWVDDPLDNYGMVLVADPCFFYGQLMFMSRETDDEPYLELNPYPFPVESLSWGLIKATEW